MVGGTEKSDFNRATDAKRQFEYLETVTYAAAPVGLSP